MNGSNEYIVSFTTNGNAQRLCYQSTDKVGNISQLTCSWNVLVDKTAPAKPILESFYQDGSGNYKSGDWTNKGVNIKSTSSDSGSGGVKTYYSYDQKEWLEDWTGTNSSIVTGLWTGERNNTIYFKAVDAAGNTSEYATMVLRIDKTKPNKPVLQSTYTDGSGTYTSGSWTNKSVNIKSISSDSGSGGVKTYYSYDQSTWHEDWNGANSSVVTGTWTGEYNMTVYFKTVDAAGNTSEYATMVFRIDKTAPKASICFNYLWDMTKFELKGLTFDASSSSDSGSGIARYYFSICAGTICNTKFESTTSPTFNRIISGLDTNLDQSLSLSFYVVDNVGNTSEEIEGYWPSIDYALADKNNCVS